VGRGKGGGGGGPVEGARGGEVPGEGKQRAEVVRVAQRRIRVRVGGGAGLRDERRRQDEEEEEEEERDALGCHGFGFGGRRCSARPPLPRRTGWQARGAAAVALGVAVGRAAGWGGGKVVWVPRVGGCQI